MWICRDQDCPAAGFKLTRYVCSRLGLPIHVSVRPFREDAALPRARLEI